MVSLFPQMLFLAPAGLGLIRVTAGLYFLSMSYWYFTNRAKISHERVPLITRMPQWLLIIGIVLLLGTGACLVAGYYTQAAAIIGAIFALKSAILTKRYPSVFPLSRDASILLLVICLCLIVSGAGAFAFDLPL